MGLFDENYKNSIAFSITNACNTYCKYCYRSANKNDKEELRFIDIKKVVEYFELKYPHEKKRYVILSGGELFVHPEIFSIISLLLERGYFIRLQTNGLCIREMTDEQLTLLSNPSILFKLSLDGSKASIHEHHRANGSFDKVVDAIKILKTFNQNNIGVISVISEYNIDDLPNLFELCIKLGVRGFTYNILRNVGYAKGLEREIVSEERIIRKIIPYLKNKEYRTLLNGTNLFQYALLGTNVLESPGQFYIFCDGGVYSDNRLTSGSMGNICVDDNYDSIFDEKNLQKYVKGSISLEVYQEIINALKEVMK